MLSVVIPTYNEEKNVKPLFDKLIRALREIGKKYEIIFVDDGSTDKTFGNLKKLAKNNKNLKIIKFKRNFGQSAAIFAGFQHCKGDVIISMDADLQNDPRDIPRMIDKINEGYDVVTGWRFDRKDAFLNRRLPSIIANKIISWTTQVSLHDYGCTLKAFRREVIKNKIRE